MAVQVTKVNEGFIRVNDKVIIKDINGQWVTAVELTQWEKEALSNFIAAEDKNQDNHGGAYND